MLAEPDFLEINFFLIGIIFIANSLVSFVHFMYLGSSDVYTW